MVSPHKSRQTKYAVMDWPYKNCCLWTQNKTKLLFFEKLTKYFFDKKETNLTAFRFNCAVHIIL